jgi:hypothetical protein
MLNKEDIDQRSASDLTLCAFALSDCTVEIESQLAKYLRAVHRTALELAVPNLFGFEIGGFWLTPAQLSQLRRLPECYPANEIDLVKRAVETYLRAQTDGLYLNSFISAEILANASLFAINRP